MPSGLPVAPDTFMPGESTILIVDDNARNVNILRMILGPHYRLATAASGEEALALAPTVRPDLILLDIMMPGLDGYETCRRLKADPALRWAKIIMVSAKAMVSERLQGYEAGADDYVTKPFDQDEILAKVRVYLRLKSVEEVDALKSDFLSLLSHETRTPLTGIMGSAELLMSEEALDVGGRQEFARAIHTSARRLHELLQKVMTLVELKAGTVAFEAREADVAKLIEHAVAGVAAQAAEKRITIDRAFVARPLALVDPKHLVMAVGAILDNAIRFSPPGGAVMIGLSADEDRVRVTVRDRGSGIAADFLPLVFEEFTDINVDHHSEGHGLSLAIARRLVKGHDGTIRVDSEPGTGTIVTVELPVASSEDPAVRSAGVSQ